MCVRGGGGHLLVCQNKHLVYKAKSGNVCVCVCGGGNLLVCQNKHLVYKTVFALCKIFHWKEFVKTSTFLDVSITFHQVQYTRVLTLFVRL